MTKKDFAFCNDCRKRTEHEVLFSDTQFAPTGPDVEIITNDEDANFAEYQLIKCQGCEARSYRSHFFGDILNTKTNSYKAQYPPRITRPKPAWVSELPSEMKSVLTEVYSAFHTGNLFLASIGVRTVLDLIFTDKLGDIGGFQKKTKEFERQGFITSGQSTLVNVIAEAGNASAHRAFFPSSSFVSDLLDLIEHLLDKLYAFEIRDKKHLKTASILQPQIPLRK